MELTKEAIGGVTVIRAAGDLTAATCKPLEDAVRAELAAGSKRIVVDLSAVRYVASAGLRVFMIAAKNIGADGRFILSGANTSVRQVLDLTGLSGLIAVHPDVEDALRAAAG